MYLMNGNHKNIPIEGYKIKYIFLIYQLSYISVPYLWNVYNFNYILHAFTWLR